MARNFEGIWIPKDLWLRTDLTITEKILYLEVKSYDNEFGCIATNKTLCEDIRIKPSTVSGLLKSLEEKGWIKITYKNMVNFEGRIIRVKKDYQTPSEKSIPPSEESGGASEESIHSNTISNIVSKDTIPTLSDSKKCELFVEKFNHIRKSKFQPLKKVCSALSQRLKNYTTKEIFKALENAMQNPYHINNKYADLTPEFILREDKLDKYLNAETIDSQEDDHQSSLMASN